MDSKKNFLLFITLFAVISTLSVFSAFGGELPFEVRNYYGDWNLVALAATPKQQNAYWKLLEKGKDVDLRGLSQRDALIVGAMVNIYRNYPAKVGSCPVKDTVIIPLEASMRGNVLSVRCELRFVGRLRGETGTNDLNSLFRSLESVPKAGISASVWEYVHDEYRLKANLSGGILIR
jgi:hypothetical protein